MKYIPPWKEPYFIGVAGCSGSGKTSVTNAIIRKLNVPWTIQLSMDNFYKVLTEEQSKLAFLSEWDFDSPESLDFDLLLKVIKDLKHGKSTEIPIYSFVTHSRTDKTIKVFGANVVILEGIYALYDPRIRDILDLQVFIKEDYDVCLARRLHRDIVERGREIELCIQQWHKFVKPNYLANILPTQRCADIVLPNGSENHIGIDMVISHIRRQLVIKSKVHLKELQKLGGTQCDITQFCHVITLTPQVQGIHTILLDRYTPRGDFVFYFNRIADIMITKALDIALTNDSEPVTIDTPTGHSYQGITTPFDKVTAVTLVRGGEMFETALKASIPTIKLGRLLIQSDSLSGEPHLHTQSFPPCLADKKVLLCDVQILSGAAAVMAIAVLIDHGVSQEDITFITYSASELGARRIHNAFPKVNIVAGLMNTSIYVLGLDHIYYGA